MDPSDRDIEQEKVANNEGMWIFGFLIGLLYSFRRRKTLNMIHHHNEIFRFGGILSMSIRPWQAGQQKTQQQKIFNGSAGHINLPVGAGTMSLHQKPQIHHSTAEDAA